MTEYKICISALMLETMFSTGALASLTCVDDEDYGEICSDSFTDEEGYHSVYHTTGDDYYRETVYDHEGGKPIKVYEHDEYPSENRFLSVSYTYAGDILTNMTDYLAGGEIDSFTNYDPVTGKKTERFSSSKDNHEWYDEQERVIKSCEDIDCEEGYSEYAYTDEGKTQKDVYSNGGFGTTFYDVDEHQILSLGLDKDKYDEYYICDGECIRYDNDSLKFSDFEIDLSALKQSNFSFSDTYYDYTYECLEYDHHGDCSEEGEIEISTQYNISSEGNVGCR